MKTEESAPPRPTRAETRARSRFAGKDGLFLELLAGRRGGRLVGVRSAIADLPAGDS